MDDIINLAEQMVMSNAWAGSKMYLRNVTSHKRLACNRHKIVMFLLHFAFKSLIDMSPSIVARNLSIITINKKPND
jgi:hypothetical protein